MQLDPVRFAPDSDLTGTAVKQTFEPHDPIRSRSWGFFSSMRSGGRGDHRGEVRGSGLNNDICNTKLLRLSGAKSPGRICKYFSYIFCAADF